MQNLFNRIAVWFELGSIRRYSFTKLPYCRVIYRNRNADFVVRVMGMHNNSAVKFFEIE
jgi:hypothetical protein